MFKKHTIVMLSSNSADKLGKNLFKSKRDSLLFYLTINETKQGMTLIPQHLYILSDEEIKEGDWKYNPTLNLVWQHNRAGKTANNFTHSDTKKIIASTNKSLGLYRLSDKFIQKYCELGSIDEVMVEYENIWIGYETVYDEEFGECQDKVYELALKVASDNTIIIKSVKNSWNREEVIDLLKKFHEDDNVPNVYLPNMGFDQWIEENL